VARCWRFFPTVSHFEVPFLHVGIYADEIVSPETISVIHHSFTEFLKGSTRESNKNDYPVLETSVTHHRLALACLSYLQSGCFDDIRIPTNSPNGRNGRPRQDHRSQFLHKASEYPALPAFTQYAATNWHVHVRKSMLAGFDQSHINAALDDFVANKDFDKWIFVADIGCDHATPLFVAVKLGLTQYCKRLLARADANADKGDQYEPPLYHAAKNGFDDIVALLIEQGADLTECDKDGYRALHIAVMHNHPKIVGILLRAGADPFCKPEKTDRFYDHGLELNGTPIMKACSYGHVDTVAELLPYLRTEAAVTDALFVAVRFKKPAVVALLLTHPLANVNKKSGPQSLLYVACSRRDAQSIKTLLEAGAEPNTKVKRNRGSWEFRKAPEGSGYTAIHALAGAGSLRTRGFLGGSRTDQPPEKTIEAFELMLKFGTNVHQVDPHGQNALFHACDGVTARILLDAGVDSDLVNEDGENLLHCHKDLDILRHLVDRTKIDTTLRVRYWETTPLLKSLKDGLVEKALLLLEFGADCTGCNKDGNGAFHLAVGINYRDRNKGLQGPLFAQLRAAGADANMRNKSGCTPLHTLDFRNFDDELFTLLLEAGLDTEAKNDGGETALFVALKACSDYELLKVCDKMVAAGCNLHAVDNKGRNLLHVLKSLSPKVVQHLVEKGLNPKQTDVAGNTLWHVAAELGSNAELFQKLRELDLDPEQPDHAGRTPHHVFSSLRPRALDDYSFKISGSPIAETTHFDDFLGYIMQIDPIDTQGITPLHLASTFSEYLTKRLLAVGADPLRRTEEGLTVFHLAARSRQPNIIGVLFDFFKIAKNSHDLIPTLNVEDRLGRTPLFYACASGCIESVKMLVEAGAKVDSDRYEGSTLQGCVAFEDENKNWEYRYRADGRDYDWSAPCSGGVTIEDKTRPDMREAHHDSSGFKHRIDEITKLISGYKTYTERFIVAALEDAVRHKLDYTVDCLTSLQTNIDIAIPRELAVEANVCLQRRQQIGTSSSRYYACWQDRKFDLATEKLMEDGLISTISFRMARVHQLVHDGFVSILERVLTPEIAQKFDDMDWVSEQVDASDRSKLALIAPLLITACQRDLPNMDMIRFLVERMGVNVNAQKRSKYTSYGQVENQSALHYLVRGLNWWQTRQALPYLLSQGAILDVRDSYDMTPLRASLDRVKTILLDKYPIEMLINAGADVNAEDIRHGRRGMSCLSRVVDDTEMTKYLLEHGAIVDHFDVRNAISKGRSDVLNLLLSHGGDPNGRDTQGAQYDDRSQYNHSSRGDNSAGIRGTETMFPLHYLATISTQVGVGEELANVLLRHGANINVCYEDTTLMHCILKNSRIARSLLMQPDLDIEATDAEGCTLLLAASQEQGSTQQLDTLHDTGTSLVRVLLGRGANIGVRDNSGKNVLHQMLSDAKRKQSGSYYSRVPPRNADIGYIASLAPALVHEQDTDGNTPLHYAAKTHIKLVAELLDAGAGHKVKNNKGQTALHYLMQGRWIANADDEIVGLRRELVERLLAMGADLHARNDRAETPVFLFFRTGSVAPDEAASKERKVAYQRGGLILEAPLYALFENMGVKWTDVDIDNQSLLHIVAAMGRSSRGIPLHRFAFLLSKGLDVATEDKWRRTPLDVAAGHQHAEIMALYTKEGLTGRPRSERYP
jgi:ankyrin repeat protein